MTWEYFYSHHENWQESTVLNRIGSLTDIGTPREIMDVLENYCDDKTIAKLLHKAAAAGVFFNGDELAELADMFDHDAVCDMIIASVQSGIVITPKQWNDLYECLNTKAFLKLAQSGILFRPQQIADWCFDLNRETIDTMVRSALEHRLAFTAEQIHELKGRADLHC